VAVEAASDASATVDAELDAVIESPVVMSFTAGGDAVLSTTAAREARCDCGGVPSWPSKSHRMLSGQL
jgi:hypothetical protein